MKSRLPHARAAMERTAMRRMLVGFILLLIGVASLQADALVSSEACRGDTLATAPS